MKKSFIPLLLALIILRFLDFLTTYRSTPTLSDEINPIHTLFQGGWFALIISNLIIISATIYLHYYYSYKYIPQTNSKNAYTYTQFLSLLYFNTPNKFYQVFYKMPINKSVFFGHLGYVLIRSIIFGSILAVLNNLFHYYDVSFYIIWCDFIKHPAYFIYSMVLIFFILCFYYLTLKEYKLNQ